MVSANREGTAWGLLARKPKSPASAFEGVLSSAPIGYLWRDSDQHETNGTVYCFAGDDRVRIPRSR